MLIRSLVVALLAVCALPATATADAIIVKREPGMDRAERLAVRAEAGVTLHELLPLPDTEVVTPRGDVDDALEELNANPDVVYAEPDVPVRPQSNDPSYGSLFGLENTGQTIWGQAGVVDADIDAPEAWVRTRGAGSVVAVVDTGIDVTHPDLAGQITGNPGERGAGRETNGVDDDVNGFVDDWQGWDYVNGDNTVETQANGHGTHVAGTIAAAAENGIGIAGVAPDATVLPVKIFGAPGSQASSIVIAQAFDYAGALGVAVVNASLGGFGTSQLVSDVIAAHPDTLYVVSAGNSDDDAALYMPCNAAAANVVCVGASDNRDQPSWFTNFSATAVDLFAPGESVNSTYLNGGYAYMNGTSMAAPHVSGVAALLAAAEPGTTTLQRRSALLSSVDARASLDGLAVTGGRANAAAALDTLARPAPTPTPTPTPSPQPTPTPEAPPAPTPPAPPVTVAPPVKTPTPITLKLTGTKITYSAPAGTRISFTLRGRKVVRWTAKASTGTLKIGRRMGGHKVRPGRYTLTLTSSVGTRAVSFRVR